jgi:pimeloyl-ACP methyl ester carboxylesterase
MAGYTGAGPGAAPDEEGGPFDPQRVFDEGNAVDASASFGGGGLIGGLLSPLRQLSYWKMKKRARSIGERGMHDFMTALMTAAPAARVHLMGHSFGCIVMSSLVGGPKASHALPRPVDSLALIQGAVSLWAFGETIQRTATPGYFNRWVKRQAVRGPIIVSQSIHDTAVGRLYPWASAVSFADGSFDAEEELPLHGAIGRFGICGLTGAVFQNMLPASGRYSFQAGKVYNLESSGFIKKGGGVSGAHSDIDGPEVAHALWQAALV